MADIKPSNTEYPYILTDFNEILNKKSLYLAPPFQIPFPVVPQYSDTESVTCSAVTDIFLSLHRPRQSISVSRLYVQPVCNNDTLVAIF